MTDLVQTDGAEYSVIETQGRWFIIDKGNLQCQALQGRGRFMDAMGLTGEIGDLSQADLDLVCAHTYADNDPYDDDDGDDDDDDDGDKE